MAKKPKEIWIESLPMEDDIMTVSTGNYQEKYLYGKSIEAIDYNTGVKNKPTTVWSPKPWHTSYSSTWVKTISWIWFTPTMIKIHGGINGGNTWYSDWYYFSSTIYCQYVYFNVGVGTVWNTTSYSSYVQRWGNASSSTTITPTSDWFTINVNDVSAGTLQISYECYQ